MHKIEVNYLPLMETMTTPGHPKLAWLFIDTKH